jgi:long-chain fatty acid transport protein
MKKALYVSLILAFLAPTVLFAGSFDYLTNQSARWLFSLSRNASTDAADIVNYNPAGTVFLPRGLSLDLSSQTLFKFYKNTDSTFKPGQAGSALFGAPVTNTFEQDHPTPSLPNLYAAYNFGDIGPGKLAVYGQAGVPAGGGDLKWKNGTAGTSFALNGLRAQLASLGMNIGPLSSQEFTASSVYYGIALGGAYSFLDDLISLSLGARLVIPQRSFSLSASYGPGYNLSGEYEYSALGVTPIIGFDLRPIKNLTVALRYEAETNLEFEYKEKSVSGSLATAGKGLLASSGISDGKKFHQNLPHTIALGAEYQLNPQFAFSLSGNLYLLSLANLGETYSGGVKVGDISDYFGVGWEIALGGSYKITDAIKLGLGLMYTESGVKDSYFNDQLTILNASANPPLNSIAFGLGGSYTFNNGLDLILSFLYSHYLPADYSVSQYSGPYEVYNVSGTYNKDVIEIGIGVGYKF